MPICACGCNEPTKGGTYRPGHDSILRGKIEESVGGLLHLNQLIEAAHKFAAGELPAAEYQQITRKLLGEKTDS